METNEPIQVGELDATILKEYLRSRHSPLVFGLILIFSSFLIPTYVSYLSNVSFIKTFETASMWFNHEYTDCSAFSRELMVVTLGLHTGYLFFVFGLSYVFFFLYPEIKYRSVAKYLKHYQSRMSANPTTSK